MNNASEPGQSLVSALTQQLLYSAEALRRCLEAALEPCGLSLPKIEVLHVLVAAGEALPLGVVTERLGCAKSNVTQLMDRLEGDGLVRRLPGPHDRRSILADVTETGRERWEVGTKAMAAAEAEFLRHLPPSERGRLTTLLSRFRFG